MRSVSRRLSAGVITLGCIVSVLVVATPAQASPAGLVMVSAVSAENSTDFKSVSAVCPAGKKVIGGGAQAFGWGASPSLLVTQAYPDGANNRFYAGAWEDEDRTSEVWTVTAYAICANPLAGLEYIATPWYTNISGTWAVCSAGKKLVGSGGHITGSNGEVALAGVFPSTASPTRSETWVTEDDNGYSGSYQVRSISVCANPIAGLERVIKSVPDTGGVGTWVTCPVGKKVLSSGARLGGPGGTVFNGEAKFSLMAPNSGLTSSYISGDQFADTGDTFTTQAIAMCA